MRAGEYYHPDCSNAWICTRSNGAVLFGVKRMLTLYSHKKSTSIRTAARQKIQPGFHGGIDAAFAAFSTRLIREVSRTPMAFLIGIWGHERRIYAAVKFVLYTMAGSILMLVGIVWLYNVSIPFTPNNTGTFDLVQIQALLQSGVIMLPARTEMLLFLAFFVAFAIKVPLFPLHTWLPDAHVEAPTAGSVILAGVLLKMGTYGMIRFCLPLFPEAAHRAAPYVAGLAIIGIIYGALVAMVQPNLKKLVAVFFRQPPWFRCSRHLRVP